MQEFEEDQKVSFDTQVLIDGMEAQEQDMCIIKALLLEQTELLRDLRQKYTESLELLTVKNIKNKKNKENTQTRANILKPFSAKLKVVKDSVIYRSLSNSSGGLMDNTKFRGRRVKDIESFEKKRNLTPPHPMYFFNFVRGMTEDPHNCCFYMRGERAYTCGTDDNRWFQVPDRNTLFQQLRNFLWDTYTTYIRMCVTELDKTCKDEDKIAYRERLMSELDDISMCEIPLPKRFMVNLITDSFNWGKNQPTVVKLGAAYRTRKK